ncbi:hypothetical protein GHT06_021099 [Daphnia sinensis]|uniref:Uncharacterized protein n=1 Tax=Daphnia sinensis TaxID=1820382 RepID=A0AAD5KIQ7_9CRUS|nr:hypothetical protein GHT06_021099 [Daphnia sinensis]
MKIERSLTQNETCAPNCPADKPDAIDPTIQTPTASQFTDLRKAYKEDLKRTNRSLTEAKLALEDAASTRKEQERQLEVHKNQLRLAKQQEEQHVQTEIELRTLLNETKKELTRTKRILRRQKARHAKSQDQENVNQDLDNSSNVPSAIENDTATTSSDPVDTTTTEQTPKSKKSRFVELVHKLQMRLGRLRKSRANKPVSVRITMNEQPVNMVIDKGCFESIISLDQWRQLGEPQLKEMRYMPCMKNFRATSKRSGVPRKSHVKWGELNGFFYATVKFQNKIAIVPIYLCTVEKTMPNFLGRRVFYDLQLHKQNAHLIELTHTNETELLPQTEQPDSVPETANTTESITDNTTDSTAEEESEGTVLGVAEVGSQPEPVYEPSAPENTDVSTANEEPEKEKVADSVTVLQALIDKIKEKNKVKRDKYEKRMAELVPKVTEVQQAELDKLVGLESTENTSESNVPQSDHYANCVALKKAISQLKSIYKKDQNKARKVLGGATVELTALKKEIARTPLNSKWIELTDDAERKEEAFEAVTDQLAADFADKMKTHSDAEGVLPKFTPATKVKYFFKTIFGIKQKN